MSVPYDPNQPSQHPAQPSEGAEGIQNDADAQQTPVTGEHDGTAADGQHAGAGAPPPYETQQPQDPSQSLSAPQSFEAPQSFSAPQSFEAPQSFDASQSQDAPQNPYAAASEPSTSEPSTSEPSTSNPTSGQDPYAAGAQQSPYASYGQQSPYAAPGQQGGYDQPAAGAGFQQQSGSQQQGGYQQQYAAGAGAATGATAGAGQSSVHGIYEGPLSGLAVEESEERTWGMLAHLSVVLASVLSAGLLMFLGPLIVYLMYKDRSRFIRFHAAEALNGAIIATVAAWILMIVALILSFILIGLLLLPLVWLVPALYFVYAIIGAVKANNGEWWNYPLTPRMFR